MAHSNQIREVLITDRGIQLLDVPVSSGEVRMGSARVAMEARERDEERERREEADRKKRLFEQKRLEKEARIATIETSSTRKRRISRNFSRRKKSPEGRRRDAPLGAYAKPIRTVRAGPEKTGAPRGTMSGWRFEGEPRGGRRSREEARGSV
jgi:hypothetical protein